MFPTSSPFRFPITGCSQLGNKTTVDTGHEAVRSGESEWAARVSRVSDLLIIPADQWDDAVAMDGRYLGMTSP
jgi:hypothetical protein